MLVLNPERLKEARIRAGLSQREAADRLSVSRTTIVNAEQGHTSPSTEVLGAMASVYGVSPAELFHDSDATEPPDSPQEVAGGGQEVAAPGNGGPGSARKSQEVARNNQNPARQPREKSKRAGSR